MLTPAERTAAWRRANPDRQRAHRLRSDARHRDAVNARKRVWWHLRTGALVRQPCVRCGAEPVEAHHPAGYQRGAPILWLCRVHHVEEHVWMRWFARVWG